MKDSRLKRYIRVLKEQGWAIPDRDGFWQLVFPSLLGPVFVFLAMTSGQGTPKWGEILIAVLSIITSIFGLVTASKFAAIDPGIRKAIKAKRDARKVKRLCFKFAVALLDIFLKEDEHDDFFEHFDESFEKRRKRSGVLAARLWVWKQVALAIGPFVWRVVRGVLAVWKLDEIWKRLF